MKITLPFPPSANLMWRSVARIGKNGKPFATVMLSKEGRQFKMDCDTWLAAHKTEVLEGPVSVTITAFFPNRRGDLDNRTKPILDVLQGFCYKNDSQVVHIETRREIDKENSRAVVTVVPA